MVMTYPGLLGISIQIIALLAQIAARRLFGGVVHSIDHTVFHVDPLPSGKSTDNFGGTSDGDNGNSYDDNRAFLMTSYEDSDFQASDELSSDDLGYIDPSELFGSLETDYLDSVDCGNSDANNINVDCRNATAKEIYDVHIDLTDYNESSDSNINSTGFGKVNFTLRSSGADVTSAYPIGSEAGPVNTKKSNPPWWMPIALAPVFAYVCCAIRCQMRVCKETNNDKHNNGKAAVSKSRQDITNRRAATRQSCK